MKRAWGAKEGGRQRANVKENAGVVRISEPTSDPKTPAFYRGGYCKLPEAAYFAHLSEIAGSAAKVLKLAGSRRRRTSEKQLGCNPSVNERTGA